MASVVVFVATILCADVLRIKNTLAASLALPEPTQLLRSSKHFSSPLLRGLRFDSGDLMSFDFVLDLKNKEDVENKEITRLINYFLAALTVPEDDVWVNLSPFEKDRIIPGTLAQTELGRDMLGQDYILKQLSSSLTHPDTLIGKEYWLNNKKENIGKIWIKPNKSIIYENKDIAYISEATLKAVTEEGAGFDAILAKITDDVNNGKNFTKLRQFYHSVLLATWFKQKFKSTFYKQYIDQNKITGIDLEDKQVKHKIYNLYVEAYKKGVYNYIKKESDLKTDKKVKKRYFSGGISNLAEELSVTSSSASILKRRLPTALKIINVLARVVNNETTEISPQELDRLADDLVEAGKSASLHAHGANANALIGALRADGKLLAGLARERKNIPILSGEGMGQRGKGINFLNEYFVSTINMGRYGTHQGIDKGHLSRSISYANLASKKGEFKITPKNVNKKIRDTEGELKLVKDLGVDDVFYLSELELKLKRLKKIKDYFNGISFQQKAEVKRLSEIPVLFIGTGYYSDKIIAASRDYENLISENLTPEEIRNQMVSGGTLTIKGEDIVEELHVKVVATTKEKVSELRQILQTRGRSDIEVVTFEQAEILHTLYLHKRSAPAVEKETPKSPVLVQEQPVQKVKQKYVEKELSFVEKLEQRLYKKVGLLTYRHLNDSDYSNEALNAKWSLEWKISDGFFERGSFQNNNNLIAEARRTFLEAVNELELIEKEEYISEQIQLAFLETDKDFRKNRTTLAQFLMSDQGVAASALTGESFSYLENDQKCLAQGDVHANLQGLKANLMQARYINNRGSWIAGKNKLVQLGDIIDRGADSIACFDFLMSLQDQARRAGGDVEILYGNHEQMLFLGSFVYTTEQKGTTNFGEKKAVAFRDGPLIDAIRQKKIKMAYVVNDVLFSHAGVQPHLENFLIQEIAQIKKKNPKDVTLIEIADRMNDVFYEEIIRQAEYLKNGFPVMFQHPLFAVPQSRLFNSGYKEGTPDPGGAIWGDFDELERIAIAQPDAWSVIKKQIVGHTPVEQKFPNAAPIRTIKQGTTILGIDSALYNDVKAYAVLSDGTINVEFDDQFFSGTTWKKRKYSEYTQKEDLVKGSLSGVKTFEQLYDFLFSMGQIQYKNILYPSLHVDFLVARMQEVRSEIIKNTERRDIQAFEDWLATKYEQHSFREIEIGGQKIIEPLTRLYTQEFKSVSSSGVSKEIGGIDLKGDSFEIESSGGGVDIGISSSSAVFVPEFEGLVMNIMSVNELSRAELAGMLALDMVN